MTVKKHASPARLKRRTWLGSLGAAFALVLSFIVPTAAFSAPPQAGTYEGTSSAYTGATMSFEIDSNGVIGNFDSTSYCSDGMFVQPVYWAGGPGQTVEAGVPFELEWEYTDDGFGTYYELQGTVNADGTASGSGRAGFLPLGTCGGMNFTWTANIVGGGDPDPVYEPEIFVTPNSLTESELAQSGLHIEGIEFPPTSSVDLLVNGTVVDSAQSLYNGSVIFEYTSNTLGAGTHEIRLTSGTYSVSTSVTVNADPVVYDPSASVAPEQLTVSELADTGVTITGEGFAPDSTVTLAVAGTNQNSAQTNAAGSVTFNFTSTSLGAGTHTAQLTAAEGSASASFTVTEDPVPVYNPSVSFSPAVLTLSELADSGISITGHEFPTNVAVTLLVNGEEITVETSDDSGEVTFNYTSTELEAGEHTFRLEADAEGAYIQSSFTVTEDDVIGPITIPEIAPTTEDLDPTAEGDIEVPAEAAPGDEITVTLTGVAPGTEVGVWLFSEPVYLGTHTVDENGQVTVVIPVETTLGEHTIAAWSLDGIIGWANLSIAAADTGDDDTDGDDTDGNDTGGDDTADDTTGKDDLATTGAADATVFALLGATLMLAGAGFLLMRRRRGQLRSIG